MEQFWITLLSIVAGAGGYLIATFWVRPILRYKDLKYQIASDLVFFANAIELQKLDGSLREDTWRGKMLTDDGRLILPPSTIIYLPGIGGGFRSIKRTQSKHPPS
jgi:hypothetical protein